MPVARARAVQSDPKRVDARPEKRFFISMLVKDIELIPAIADLVDNSVDGARAEWGDDMSNARIDLTLEPESFEIVDNCGGIPIQVAREYAFRFGRPEDFEGVEWSVGQFGVGMKRALFKLGRSFSITSRTGKSFFKLGVDVNKWAKDENPDWSFAFDEFSDSYKLKRGEKPGTGIRVIDLHPSVIADFSKTAVESRLRADLQLRHQEAISDGLTICLNGEELKSVRPVLVYEPDLIVPIHREFKLNVNGGVVGTRLLAGIIKGDAERDDDDPEQFMGTSDAGWYLYCNRRLLFAAERSWLTGWGTVAADYHPQYRNFRGYVFLSSADPALLPWNTTKTGVDEDSSVFRQLQGEMGNALKRVQAVINLLKREVQQKPPAERTLTAAVRSSSEVPLDALPSSSVMKFPEPPKRRASGRQTVRYTVEKERYEAVRGTLDVAKPGEVGLATFDHYYRTRVQ